MPKDPAKNPALDAEIQDLFEKDPENFSEEDLERAVKYYRDLRTSWAKAEEEKEQKKKDKKNPRTVEDVEQDTF